MDIFSDSTLDAELETIKKKIDKLYNSLLEAAYRAKNPGASPEDIEAFLEENSLDFPETAGDELDELLGMIDSLTEEDDLDPVSEKAYSKPDVESGAELGAKSKDAPSAPKTVNIKEPKGMFQQPQDSRVKVKTSKVAEPTGIQKRSENHERHNIIEKKTIRAVLDKERQRLLRLVKKRNKEFGVIL